MAKMFSILDTAPQILKSPDTVRRMIKRKEIEAIQIGRKYMVSEDEIKRLTVGKSQKMINLFSELTQAGFSANNATKIITIVHKVL